VGVGIVEAARDYARRHAGIVADKSVRDAVAELLGQIEAEQKNTRNGIRRKEAWVKLLRAHLGKLARDVSGPVASLDSALIEPWLVGLKCSERTRRNVRDCLGYFVRWAQGRNYLPKDAEPLRNVQNFRKRKLGAVQVISAEHLARLLKQAPRDFVPYLALRAFAGLRDSEARALDWQHVDLREGWIDIPEQVAKQTDDDEGVRRMIKVREVLAAWLKPHCRKSGPVCPYANTVKKLGEAAKAAGVVLPRNALRHSFISAAVTLSHDLNAVAIEAGNSAPVIRQHYWRRMRPEQATAWFGVRPDTSAAEIVSLPLAAVAA
jgi:integrase